MGPEWLFEKVNSDSIIPLLNTHGWLPATLTLQAPFGSLALLILLCLSLAALPASGSSSTPTLILHLSLPRTLFCQSFRVLGCFLLLRPQLDWHFSGLP